MELRTAYMRLVLTCAACLATWWAVWPDRYIACLEAVKHRLRRTPAMRAAVDRVEIVSPLSSSKPGYSGLLRVCGILMWMVLLWVAYTAYKY
jgi:hypothetical protein